MEDYKGFEQATIPEAKDLRTRDYILFVETYGTIDGKPNVKTNQVYLTQVSQLHQQEGTILLRSPEENINHFPKTGSTLGFVSPRDCIIPQKIKDEDLKEEKLGKPVKGAEVKVIIGKKDGVNYCIPAKYLRYESDFNRHWVEVTSQNGLIAHLPVLEKYIYS